MTAPIYTHTQNFLNKSKIIHNNKYDYSLVEYKNSRTKVKIICPEHGVFEQKVDSHIRGFGCIKCSGKYQPTTLEFIKTSNEIHNDKYDYSLVKYVNSKTKVKIICPFHGEFEQLSRSHLEGKGCSLCSLESKKLTQNEFIKKAKYIHCDFYDYSLVKYIDSNTKVKIICPSHGEFEQRASNHLNSQGCITCANERKTGGYNLTIFNRNSSLANKDATLYIIQYNNLYKIGITTLNIFQRFNKSIKIISRLDDITLIEAFNKEQKILSEYIQYKEKPIKWIYNGNNEFLNITLEQLNQIIIDYFNK